MAELVSIKRNVDVSPGQAAPAVFHCSQGDVGSKIILGLLNNGTAYAIPSGVTVTIEGSESNGSIFTPISATTSGSDITFYLTGEMTAVAGPAICQAVLKSGSNILGTANFTLEVESSPMGADAPPVFTDAGWTWMLNKLNTEFVPALGNETIIDAIGNLKTDLNYNKTATPGYVLRATDSGNGTEWSAIGLPTDEQTADAVNAWLDEHPEATTTVQDGAITEKKLSESIQAKIRDPYIPFSVGTLTYTSSGNSTIVDFVIIDKSYKPRLVLAGDEFKQNGNMITGDVGIISMREGATVACNASTWHNSSAQSGTIITDGTVKHENDLSYQEWESYGLENLYMTEDGALHTIDSFSTLAEMTALNPVWSFNGWNAIYKDGQAVDTYYKDVYTPKTVIAQAVNGDYLILASGGRRPNNFGMIYSEIIDVIINKIGFNAKIIYNCDGGGSSSLVVDQIRLNDLVENNPRPVPTVLIFGQSDINTSDHSEYASGHISSISNLKARSEKKSVYTDTFDIVSGNSQVGIRFFKATADNTDKYSFKQALKFGYDFDNNSLYIDALRSTGRYLNAISIIDSQDSAQLLGKEVLRGTAIKVIDGTYTTNSSGIIDSNAIMSGGLSINNNYILSVTPLDNDTVILVGKYSSRYLFNVKNNSTLDPKANTSVTLRILYITDPSYTV